MSEGELPALVVIIGLDGTSVYRIKTPSSLTEKQVEILTKAQLSQGRFKQWARSLFTSGSLSILDFDGTSQEDVDASSICWANRISFLLFDVVYPDDFNVHSGGSLLSETKFSAVYLFDEFKN